MKRNRFNGLRIWSGNITFYLMVAVLHFLSPSLGQAEAPEHSVVEGGVQLRGVGPQNPIIYDNDWWFDVFDNNYLWAQTSLGNTDLRGNIVSRDM